jgi:hypothetical protein
MAFITNSKEVQTYRVEIEYTNRVIWNVEVLDLEKGSKVCLADSNCKNPSKYALQGTHERDFAIAKDQTDFIIKRTCEEHKDLLGTIKN